MKDISQIKLVTYRAIEETIVPSLVRAEKLNAGDRVTWKGLNCKLFPVDGCLYLGPPEASMWQHQVSPANPKFVVPAIAYLMQMCWWSPDLQSRAALEYVMKEELNRPLRDVHRPGDFLGAQLIADDFTLMSRFPWLYRTFPKLFPGAVGA